MTDNRACKNTPEHMCASALKHYDELSTKCHSWYNQIPQAIRFWYLEKPKLEAELTRLRPQTAVLLKPIKARGNA